MTGMGLSISTGTELLLGVILFFTLSLAYWVSTLATQLKSKEETERLLLHLLADCRCPKPPMPEAPPPPLRRVLRARWSRRGR